MKALVCEAYGPIANLAVKDIPSPVRGRMGGGGTDICSCVYASHQGNCVGLRNCMMSSMRSWMALLILRWGMT